MEGYHPRKRARMAREPQSAGFISKREMEAHKTKSTDVDPFRMGYLRIAITIH